MAGSYSPGDTRGPDRALIEPSSFALNTSMDASPHSQWIIRNAVTHKIIRVPMCSSQLPNLAARDSSVMFVAISLWGIRTYRQGLPSELKEYSDALAHHFEAASFLASTVG